MTESRRCGEVYSEPAADRALANPPGCDVRAQCHDQLNPSNLPNSVSTVNTPDSAEQSIPISHFLLIAPLSEIFLLLPLIPMLTQREDQKRQEMLPETRENTREQKETRKQENVFRHLLSRAIISPKDQLGWISSWWCSQKELPPAGLSMSFSEPSHMLKRKEAMALWLERDELTTVRAQL